ncbi:hypothetical protein F5141DRAFT_1218260 [Pisolithus sp. B1]|nr:hypothetical protein F5141DRAFT_1218260 [Pisolithus sp. B1]
MESLFGGVQSIAEEPIAQAGSLTSQMALQSHYSSILTGGVGVSEDANDGSTRGSVNEAHTEDLSGSLGQSLDLSAVCQQPTDERFTSARQDEDHSEDSMDHLQQPGNTKKRKVPLNMSGICESAGIWTFFVAPPSVPQTTRKGKISLSALAGLQHKELLKHRKRQLAAVLGALSLGDTLALDQALSTHIPFVNTMLDAPFDAPKVRLSHRRGPRLARAARAEGLSDANSKAAFPTAQFTFSYPSTTSERLLATKKEMLALRSRFEAELARQASKVARAATQAKKAGVEATKASRPKRSDKAQQRPRTAPIDRPAELSNPPSLGKSRGEKKKKTSADFRSAGPKELHPFASRRLCTIQSGEHQPKHSESAWNPSFSFSICQHTSAQMESSCCNADSSDPTGLEYKRAIRNRKKTLQRRRRAQERAAGGLNVSKTLTKAGSNDGDCDDYDQSSARSPAISKSSEWKQGLDIKETKREHHLQSG